MKRYLLKITEQVKGRAGIQGRDRGRGLNPGLLLGLSVPAGTGLFLKVLCTCGCYIQVSKFASDHPPQAPAMRGVTGLSKESQSPKGQTPPHPSPLRAAEPRSSPPGTIMLLIPTQAQLSPPTQQLTQHLPPPPPIRGCATGRLGCRTLDIHLPNKLSLFGLPCWASDMGHKLRLRGLLLLQVHHPGQGFSTSAPLTLWST